MRDNYPKIGWQFLANIYAILDGMIKRRIGDYIIKGGANVWPHEERTARTFIMAGYTVEFIRKSERERERSADILIDGEKWEMKAPTSGKMSAVEDNLKKASKQSDKIIFDSRRMKRIPSSAIERELTTKALANKRIRHLKFINRHGEIIDIK